MRGQEYIADTWAMANMNMIIHDMEGEIEIGDAFKKPRPGRSGCLSKSGTCWNVLPAACGRM
jgi:type I restriction-modification system DNA methylase subunit